MHPLEQLHPESLARHAATIRALLRTRLWAQVLVALVLGIGAGYLLGPSKGLVAPAAADVIGNWLALPGHLFIAVVQMIVVPLVLSSIILGLAAGETPGQLRKMGLMSVMFFMSTTVVALCIGLGTAFFLQPGHRGDFQSLLTDSGPPIPAGEVSAFGFLPETLSALIPENPLGAMVEGEMLQVVIFSIIFGVAVINLKPERARLLIDLLAGIQEVCLIIVRWAMVLAPLAVFGLMAQVVMRAGPGVLAGLSAYVATVCIALALHVVFYLLLVVVLGRMPLGRFLRAAREPQLLAFATSSSAAVMPLSIEVAEKRLGTKPSIAQFVVPMGATINMDGTAVYQAVATVFLAQVFGVELTLAGLTLVVITALGASVGAPATPGVGIVLLSMVLKTVGIPLAGIALIIGVDRLLDMTRTVVNVTGDLTACVLINRWAGDPQSPDPIPQDPSDPHLSN